MTCTSPASSAACAAGVPRYGTCTMSAPLIILNSSAERWLRFPLPLDPMLTLPALDFTWAMNSGTVLAGREGLTIMAKESLLMRAMGTISRTTLTLLFS